MKRIYKFIDNARRMCLNTTVTQPELPANTNINQGEYTKTNFDWDEYNRKFNANVPENMKNSMIDCKIFIINDY